MRRISTLNERERYIETLTFGKPDRIPLSPGNPRESTLRRWHGEGLAAGRDWFEALCDDRTEEVVF